MIYEKADKVQDITQTPNLRGSCCVNFRDRKTGKTLLFVAWLKFEFVCVSVLIKLTDDGFWAMEDTTGPQTELTGTQNSQVDWQSCSSPVSPNFPLPLTAKLN